METDHKPPTTDHRPLTTEQCVFLATGNAHKVQEIREILPDLAPALKSVGDFPPKPGPVEDGTTYYQNALKKAFHYHALTGLPALADDSGLEIDAFGGEPGIRSARFIDPALSFEKRNSIILERMKDVGPDGRGARFRCCCALVMSNGLFYLETGTLEGQIGLEARGVNGFGYDPIFLLPGPGIHLAELSPDGKNRISHRALAFKRIRKYLDGIFPCES